MKSNKIFKYSMKMTIKKIVSIIHLTEVWLQDKTELCHLLADFTRFCLLHKRAAEFGHNIGGICVYIDISIVKPFTWICKRAVGCIFPFSGQREII